MNTLITKGLGGSATNLLLGGLGESVSTLPGSYRGEGGHTHPVFKILQRGLEVRQLYWRTEEINPMIVLVSIKRDKQSIPIRVAHLSSDNIESKVPVAMLATEHIGSIVKVAYPAVEFIEEKIPVVMSQEESILSCLNVYDRTEWVKVNPSAVLFSSENFEAKSINNLKITKSRELEFVRK